MYSISRWYIFSARR